VKPEIDALIAALARTRTWLQEDGQPFTSARVEELEARLQSGDYSAVESAVSEATGGMGSLRDNAPEALVKEVECAARTAANVLGVRLIR